VVAAGGCPIQIVTSTSQIVVMGDLYSASPASESDGGSAGYPKKQNARHA
jgi:hypothetical protein